MCYEANGIDYAADPADIRNFLVSEGSRVGEIYKADFLTWHTSRQYDIVASFGFIEHFENADEVADQHFKLAKPGGYVVIVMPNFASGQRVLHWLFDRENLLRHNTKIMNLSFLKRVAIRNSANLLEARYAGGQYAFWSEDQTLSWFATRLMWRIDRLLEKVARALPKGENPLLSPFLFAVYKMPG